MRISLRGAMGPAAAALGALLVAACGGSSAADGGGASPSPVDVGSGSLQGAGSTFVQPFFQKAFYQYNADHPGVSINYQGVGSGAGIQQFKAGTVDFGATDVPMGAADITASGGASALVQIPDTLGAVAIAYNLSGVDKLQLDGPTLADIYTGKVKKWNDPEIAALNSGVNLPSSDITPVFRSDGSGTSYIVSDYLSKAGPSWTSAPSKTFSPPAACKLCSGQKGTSGVAGFVSNHPGALGYVELAYVVQTGMHQAWLKNKNGSFVQASVAGATAAAAQATDLSASNFSIVNEPGASSYPISGYSWVVLKTDISDLQKAKALVFLFKWLVTGGQAQGASLQYAALPHNAQTYALDQLKLVMSGGKAVLT